MYICVSEANCEVCDESMSVRDCWVNCVVRGVLVSVTHTEVKLDGG